MTSPASNVAHLPAQPSIPKFEGAEVSATMIKISGKSEVESSEDIVISTDDRVRLVGEYRVVRVNHFVDEKTGEVHREQVLKPISIQLCPWDPADPTDDGIVRARQIP